MSLAAIVEAEPALFVLVTEVELVEDGVADVLLGVGIAVDSERSGHVH